ncbi:hypothetical protein FGG08_005763 [Glutinoglossum americanum]|uniref:Metal homeostatis protein bsd2 n=1 Tax=Glutinoglossum americanum TaxID=1670608 RepID=A0A9P8HXT7_9PEZI|nr:hypothetical protein FGG08_005763 [Glutinoglossum americanum]
MSSQRYERISGNEDDDNSPITPHSNQQHPIPASPPPSFHSRASSPTSERLLSQEDPLISDADRALADSFDSEGEDDGDDDRQRLMRGTNQNVETSQARAQREEVVGGRPTGSSTLGGRTMELPRFVPTSRAGSAATTRYAGSGRGVNDGVFANLSAKPEVGEKEELPPTYEQAAADATPPYWETTILAPGMAGDEVFIDGLPVGSLFSFVWNGMISMSFQLVGFLLTYLLHTTHAAKNGSRAGLGITLVQYGFYMKGSGTSSGDAGGEQYGTPPDPNSHNFNTADAAAAAVASMVGNDANSNIPNAAGSGNGSGSAGITGADWLAYLLMIVGWFILIRAVSDFLRARRHEQLVLQSPERGLSIPVVAEGEGSESVV